MKLLLLLSLSLLLVSCGAASSYQSTVSSRSVAGYAKDIDSDPTVGVRYQVNYR